MYGATCSVLVLGKNQIVDTTPSILLVRSLCGHKTLIASLSSRLLQLRELGIGLATMVQRVTYRKRHSYNTRSNKGRQYVYLFTVMWSGVVECVHVALRGMCHHNSPHQIFLSNQAQLVGRDLSSKDMSSEFTQLRSIVLAREGLVIRPRGSPSLSSKVRIGLLNFKFLNST